MSASKRAAVLGAWTAALNAAGNPAISLALGRTVLEVLGTPLVTLPGA
ncbi:MAG: hypothetical protein IPG17_27490 [Sandaracinaceae bacterium]|nr:hypothetical protein [Sandaracinaceae bacterium]